MKKKKVQSKQKAPAKRKVKATAKKLQKPKAPAKKAQKQKKPAKMAVQAKQKTTAKKKLQAKQKEPTEMQAVLAAGHGAREEGMDQQDLNEWRDFCEGRIPYTPFMLSNMFMSMFYKPLTEAQKNDLRTVFSYVPNSSKTVETLLRIAEPGPGRNTSEQEITDLVVRDLKEKRRIIDNPRLIAAMDLGICDIVLDQTRFHEVRSAPLDGEFTDAICDYVTMPDHDARISVLRNAFYGIANNLHLQMALTAGLVRSDVSFDNYVELYLSGGDYALDTNGALLINYRATVTYRDTATTVDPWLTPTVIALAQAIYDEQAFDRMPVLADALEDAGCANAEILGHCRSPCPHVRGCWVVDLLLKRKISTPLLFPDDFR